MRFRLPRQVMSQEMCAIVSREMRKQKIETVRASKKQLIELKGIVDAIRKKGFPSNLVCKKLPGKLGHGIFLHPKAKPILRGAIIAPYAGIVSLTAQNIPEDSLYTFEPICDMHLTREEQARFDKGQKYHPRRLYAMYVDAAKKGNLTRFINHSSKPNVFAEFFSVPPNTPGLDSFPLEVFYLAERKILPGEQLLVNYEGDGSSYWSSLGIKPMPITPKTFQLDSSLKIVAEKSPRMG